MSTDVSTMSSQRDPGDGADTAVLGRSPSGVVRSPASALRLIRQASSRRFLREPSIRVRESAEDQLEERQSDLAYSWPVVILDLVWNAGFIAASLIIVGLSVNERPSAPLRVWIFGYAAQCCVHMVCVWSEYLRRQELRRISARTTRSSGQGRSDGSSAGRRVASSGSYRGSGEGSLSEALLRQRLQGEPGQSEAGEVVVGTGPSRQVQWDEEEGGGDRRETTRTEGQGDESEQEDEGEDGGLWDNSAARQIESLNTMFSFVWWVVGLGWLLSTFDDTFQDAPMLTWLCMIFLAFDVFFVIFCTALACVIGIAVCCCLPCIIALLYAAGGKDGASSEAIEALPRFRFRRSATMRSPVTQLLDEPTDEADVLVEVDEQCGGYIVPVDASADTKGRPVAAEDAECCICLNSYGDDTTLRELPCGHHFDQSCLDKWLKTKPTCPLCKYDIMRKCRPGASESSRSSAGREEQAVVSLNNDSVRGPSEPATLVQVIEEVSSGFFNESGSRS